MSDELELPSADDDEFVEASTALKVAAPILAIGAGLLVRKVLDTAYEKTTGAPPPRANDRDVKLGRVLVYAAATAMAIAMVNVIIDRSTAPKRVHPGA